MGTNWTRVVWGVTSVEFGEYLGGGQFGQVYAARYQGADAAAKTTRCPIGFPPSEIELMRRAQGSKRIVGLLGIETGTLWGTCIVMALHPKGSLQQRVEACRPSRDEYLHYLQGICEGLVIQLLLQPLYSHSTATAAAPIWLICFPSAGQPDRAVHQLGVPLTGACCADMASQ